jgi:hypothetical protein
MATKSEQALGADYVRERLTHMDGVVYWLPRPRSHFASRRAYTQALTVMAGKPAGRRYSRGYVGISIQKDGKKYQVLAHRVIWMLHHGDWPSQVIDHINRDKTDNRIENLRDVSPDANARNNGNELGSGLKGSYRMKNRKTPTFKAHITVNRINTYLGTYRTAEEAHQAHLRAAAQVNKTDVSPSPMSASTRSGEKQ